MTAVTDPAEAVAQEFLRAVVADAAAIPDDDPHHVAAACFWVTPHLGWIDPCMDELARRTDRLEELRAEVSAQVRVSPGVATSVTRVEFTGAQLTPRPALDLSLTVERDRNGDWRVSHLDGVLIPTR